jgi:hypothetical protein
MVPIIPPMPPKEICIAVWTDLRSALARTSWPGEQYTKSAPFAVRDNIIGCLKEKPLRHKWAIFWECLTYAKIVGMQPAFPAFIKNTPVRLLGICKSIIDWRHTKISDRILLGKCQETYPYQSDNRCEDNVTATVLMFVSHIGNNEGCSLWYGIRRRL